MLLQSLNSLIEIDHHQRDSVDANVVDRRRVGWCGIVRRDPLHQPQHVLVAATERNVSRFDLKWLVEPIRTRFFNRAGGRYRLSHRVAQCRIESQ